jgi:hypothetical protein
LRWTRRCRDTTRRRRRLAQRRARRTQFRTSLVKRDGGHHFPIRLVGSRGQGQTAVIGHGERGAQRKWYLHLELRSRSSCERWRCAWLARGWVEAVLHKRKATIGRNE